MKSQSPIIKTKSQLQHACITINPHPHTICTAIYNSCVTIASQIRTSTYVTCPTPRRVHILQSCTYKFNRATIPTCSLNLLSIIWHVKLPGHLFLRTGVYVPPLNQPKPNRTRRWGVEGAGFYQLHDKSGTWGSRLVGYEL